MYSVGIYLYFVLYCYKNQVDCVIFNRINECHFYLTIGLEPIALMLKNYVKMKHYAEKPGFIALFVHLKNYIYVPLSIEEMVG